jgi:hypothetical protein
LTIVLALLAMLVTRASTNSGVGSDSLAEKSQEIECRPFIVLKGNGKSDFYVRELSNLGINSKKYRLRISFDQNNGRLPMIDSSVIKLSFARMITGNIPIFCDLDFPGLRVAQ